MMSKDAVLLVPKGISGLPALLLVLPPTSTNAHKKRDQLVTVFWLSWNWIDHPKKPKKKQNSTATTATMFRRWTVGRGNETLKKTYPVILGKWIRHLSQALPSFVTQVYFDSWQQLMWLREVHVDVNSLIFKSSLNPNNMFWEEA